MANIELDGPNKKIKVDSGDLTLDIPGDIILDADGGDLTFADGGTNLLKITNSSSDVVFQPQVDTKDIVFKQYDGTVVATVEDNATFNIPTDKLAINGTAITSTAAEINILDGATVTSSELNLLDGGTSVGSSITLADADGVIVNDNGTMKTIPASDVKTYVGGFDVSSITGATALEEEPALTDEMVLSDAGTLKRLDMTHVYAQPACLVGGWGTTSLYPGNNAVTLIDWATEAYDEGGCFNNTNSSTTLNGLTAPAYSFTPNVPGVYQVILNVYWAGEGIDGAAGQFTSVHFRINGSHYTKIPGIQPNQEYGLEGADDNAIQAPPAVFNIPMNGTGDYMQWYAYNLTGEAPELNFDYSSLSVTRIAGLKTTSRP